MLQQVTAARRLWEGGHALNRSNSTIFMTIYDSGADRVPQAFPTTAAGASRTPRLPLPPTGNVSAGIEKGEGG